MLLLLWNLAAKAYNYIYDYPSKTFCNRNIIATKIFISFHEKIMMNGHTTQDLSVVEEGYYAKSITSADRASIEWAQAVYTLNKLLNRSCARKQRGELMLAQIAPTLRNTPNNKVHLHPRIFVRVVLILKYILIQHKGSVY